MLSQPSVLTHPLSLEANDHELGSLPPVVLTVYFSGTYQEISDITSLAGFLAAYNQHSSTNQMVRGFDGCAIIAGKFLGGIFGVGLDGQVREVVRQVQQINKSGKKVILNCYGHSRGAIAALLLAKMLGQFDTRSVEVNLALLDPVPGNLLFTPNLDFLGTTLSSQAMDLTSCKTLRKVLCLYPIEPMPDIGYAPLIPTYPEDCIVEEDVITGCHSYTQFLNHLLNETVVFTPQVFVTFARVLDFLKSCGTKFEFGRLKYSLWASLEYMNDIDINESGKELLKKIYQHELLSLRFDNSSAKIINKCHSDRQLQIVRNESNRACLNLHHKLLSADEKNQECALIIKQKPGVISAIKRRFCSLYDAIKWLLIGASIAVGLYFSGGLMALPYLAKLGAWSIVPAIPSAAIVANILLNWIVKPLVHFSLKLCCRCCLKDDVGYYPNMSDNSKQSNAIIMDLTARATPSTSTPPSVTVRQDVALCDLLSPRSVTESLSSVSSDSINTPLQSPKLR